MEDTPTQPAVPSMHDYHLRFQDRQEMLDTLASIGVPVNPSTHTSVDEIGPVVLEPAIMDGDEELVPPVVDQRHHVNLRCREPLTPEQLETLSGHLVYPQNPVRVWG